MATPVKHLVKENIVTIFAERLANADQLLIFQQRWQEEIGLGAEFYCRSPEHLKLLLAFRPVVPNLSTVHLPYNLTLAQDACADRIAAYLDTGKFYGLTLHADAASCQMAAAALKDKLSRLNAVLKKKALLFLEYTPAIELDQYYRLFLAAKSFESISACLDTGHLALRIAAETAAANGVIDRLVDYVISFVREGKPIHLHLHDAHPLVKMGPAGLSDHLSFLGEVAPGSPKLIGVDGAKRILTAAFDRLSGDQLSVNLEIHPDYSRLPLSGPQLACFTGADPKTLAAAEIINAWFKLIEQNLAAIS